MRTRSNKDYAGNAGGDVKRRKVAGRGEQTILKESVEQENIQNEIENKRRPCFKR